MSINPKSVEFHQCHAKLHSICFCLSQYQRKKSLPRFCWQFKTPTRTWKCTHCIMQMSFLYASDFLFKNFQNRSTCRNNTKNNVWENGDDASIWVQTTINHISIFTFFMFLRQYQRQRKCFLSERELKKALLDTLTRAAWLGPSNFWLVRSEHARASYPGLFFRTPEFSPYIGREERRVQGLDYLCMGSMTLLQTILMINLVPRFSHHTAP